MHQLTDEEFLRMIGAALSSKGADGWRASKEGQVRLQWLDGCGLTEADAIQRYQAWRAEHDRKAAEAKALLAAEGTRSEVPFNEAIKERGSDAGC